MSNWHVSSSLSVSSSSSPFVLVCSQLHRVGVLSLVVIQYLLSSIHSLSLSSLACSQSPSIAIYESAPFVYNPFGCRLVVFWVVAMSFGIASKAAAMHVANVAWVARARLELKKAQAACKVSGDAVAKEVAMAQKLSLIHI